MMDTSEKREFIKPRMTPTEAKIINQRFRILAVVAFGVIAIGTVFMHFVEQLKWLDSLYFSVVSLTTVGYGDIVPKTDIGKIFVIFYLLIGIAILAALLNNLLRNAVAKRLIKNDKSPKKNN